MIIKDTFETDVLVVGAGIAGISACIEASKEDVNVIIVSSANIFSGSSFYPGAWGLGLIGPEDKDDEKDLKKTIKRIGCDLVYDDLVDTLVTNIDNRINNLDEMGFDLRKAKDSKDKSLIPCFDYKNRRWTGILFDKAKEAFGNALDKKNITQLAFVEIVEIIKEKDIVVGAIGINKDNDYIFIKTKSIILAGGGFGGLYKYRLNTNDINGLSQVCALKSGCELVNVEFIQFIPGYIKPSYKTIVGERVLNYANYFDENGNDIVDKYIEEDYSRQEVLDKRQSHGPFTTRLKSKYFDIALYKEYFKNESMEGILLKYDKEKVENTDGQLIKEYLDWLTNVKRLSIDQDFYIAPFFHASNGGIKINEDTSTKVEGIYAAGEATGGMHGADRIGGLSSANGLVYGSIAGAEAAKYAKTKDIPKIKELDIQDLNIINADSIMENVREIMYKNACIVRSEKDLLYGLQQIKDLKDNICYDSNINKDNRIKSHRANSYLILGEAILKAMIMRKESRGSHYREDYPNINNSLTKKIIISLSENIDVSFE